MRKLLGTLYVVSQDALLSLKNDNVVIERDGKEVDRYPLLSLESIVSFSRKGATVPLMTACAERGSSVAFSIHIRQILMSYMRCRAWQCITS